MITRKPPIARAVQPIPPAQRIPSSLVRTACDFVFDFGLDDGRTEIVFGLDGGTDFIAQHYRLGGRIDGHFVLWLFVLLNAETAAAVVNDVELIDAQGGIGGQIELAFDAAIGVGGELFR